MGLLPEKIIEKWYITGQQGPHRPHIQSTGQHDQSHNTEKKSLFLFSVPTQASHQQFKISQLLREHAHSSATYKNVYNFTNLTSFIKWFIFILSGVMVWVDWYLELSKDNSEIVL